MDMLDMTFQCFKCNMFSVYLKKSCNIKTFFLVFIDVKTCFNMNILTLKQIWKYEIFSEHCFIFLKTFFI